MTDNPAISPGDFVSDVSLKLAARSRHVAILTGAGMSKACGLPDVDELQQKVLKSLKTPQASAFKLLLEGRNLESALSRLRRIAAVLDDGQELENFTSESATELDAAVCKAIVQALDINSADTGPTNALARWAKGGQYHRPLEIFTLNYDLLLEASLEANSARYFDGFIGSLRARFQTESVDQLNAGNEESLPSDFIRLWKLHGSVNWVWEGDTRKEIVRIGVPASDGKAAAIYPSDTKYEESRRVPFVVLADRFRRALAEPETFFISSGYSFKDEHVDDLIYDAAARNRRSEYMIFCFDQIPDKLRAEAALSTSLTVTSPAELIMGGVSKSWKADAEIPGVFEKGKFLLGDFGALSRFLSRDGHGRVEPETHE